MPMHHVHEQARYAARARTGRSCLSFESVGTVWVTVRSLPEGRENEDGRWRMEDSGERAAALLHYPPSSIFYPRLLLPPAAELLLLVLRLGRDVERRDALADALVLFAHAGGLLEDVHVGGDVELAAAGDVLVDVLAGGDAVDGGAEAGAEELVLQVLADDGVVGADDAEDVRPAGDLAVGQQRTARH